MLLCRVVRQHLVHHRHRQQHLVMRILHVQGSKETVAQQVMASCWVVAADLPRRHHRHLQVLLVMRILHVNKLDFQEIVAQQVMV